GASFTSAGTAFEIALGLTGVLSLWLVLMKIGERAGVISVFGRMVSPLFCRLFPGVPKGHPAMGSIFMNVSANMLGLDNAATPLGLKAMQELQDLNRQKDTATDAMIMFLVLNASGLCFIPISIMMYRAQAGAANPTDVFLPILLATFISTLVGIVALCIKQRIRLLDPVLLCWLGGMMAVIGGIVWFFSSLPAEAVQVYSGFVANALLLTVIVGFIVAGLRKRINMYETFIEGAKEGFHTAVMIIPYLVAILVAIGMFRASGAMDVITSGLEQAVSAMGIDAQWVAALPTAIMKPLSGSGSRGMMVDLMNTYGADAFVSRVSAAIQGSTDTMFYVLAVYFGSVGVRRTRYAVGYALFADITGSVAGILAAYLFFA
ncbi:MAG: hypothetical protein K2L90_10865, partial [Muribaculaceae bacterium]|nr:hypothetical protein [Muribaculaceae bacterium]